MYRFPRPPFGGLPFLFQHGSSFRPPLGPDSDRPSSPPGRPPSFTPQQSPTVMAVDPGSIRRCRFRFTYLWLKNRREFWAYLTFVGRRSVAGYRWIGFRWVYFGTDLKNIESFICY
ncbi:hypothetical protein [Paramaledivibacter caminithermalis]|uniref:Transporter n=1 Tax=Paramaledivibacter caminithermalis (strain DSM 15212 / CIP 107654 / DViRD3) TaxID=1121301 RepID=A0A1M6LZM3_PARC5|nr:hypothetical protein [Paramaledivibacter caminithermalis]SHJ76719.1 hypothetical protein SAMN02745912_01001 [Paramaledivibacter caminithermalis DSM 15212]